MDEPYLLRANKKYKERQPRKGEKKEKHKEEKERRRETQSLAMTRPVEHRLDRIFPALTVKRYLLIFRLWFEGWVVPTVLVKSPKRLLQDAPSQFAYLGIAMKSGTDRLP
jgi:hypothetical protein